MSYDCYCDYDYPSVYSARTVKAKREYRCYECRAPIKQGDRHEYVFGVWSGDAGSNRTCLHCIDIRQWVKNNVPCFCWGHGNMLEDAKEAVEAACWRAPDETKGLAFGLGRLLVKAKRARASA